jgi:hypothetical protein
VDVTHLWWARSSDVFGVPCATKAVGCPHNTADLADLRRDECVVWQRAHTHRQVDVLVDEIECLVRERQMYVDLRELREALVDHRRDMETTEGTRPPRAACTARA